MAVASVRTSRSRAGDSKSPPYPVLAQLPNVLVQHLCAFLPPAEVRRLRIVNRSLSRCLDGRNSSESVFWWTALGILPDRNRNPYRIYLTCEHLCTLHPFPPSHVRVVRPDPNFMHAILDENYDGDRARTHRFWAFVHRIPNKGSLGIVETDGGYALPEKRHEALTQRYTRPTALDVLPFVYSIETDSWAFAGWDADAASELAKKRPAASSSGAAAPAAGAAAGAGGATTTAVVRSKLTLENVGTVVAVIVSIILLYFIANFEP